MGAGLHGGPDQRHPAGGGPVDGGDDAVPAGIPPAVDRTQGQSRSTGRARPSPPATTIATSCERLPSPPDARPCADAGPPNRNRVGPGVLGQPRARFRCHGAGLDMWCRCEVAPSDHWLVEEEGGPGRSPTRETSWCGRSARGGRAADDRCASPTTFPAPGDWARARRWRWLWRRRRCGPPGAEPTDRDLFELVAELEGHPGQCRRRRVRRARGRIRRHRPPTGPGPGAEAGAWRSPTGASPPIRHGRRSPTWFRTRLAARSVAQVGDAGRGAPHRRPCRFSTRQRATSFTSSRGWVSRRMTGRLIEAARAAGALHAAWSGAGPAVIAFTTAATTVGRRRRRCRPPSTAPAAHSTPASPPPAGGDPPACECVPGSAILTGVTALGGFAEGISLSS